MENYIQGCSIILRAAASYSRAETGKLIDEIEPISENTLVKAKFTRRLKNSKNIYVAAIHSCPNRNNTVSEVVTINTSKFRTKKQASLTGVLATATFDYFGF